MMLDVELLSAVANQMMANDETIELDGKTVPIKRTSRQSLKSVTFAMDGREYTAIEQNPDKPSRWGQLARDGHRVVQFKDDESGRFVAVAVDGHVKAYGTER